MEQVCYLCGNPIADAEGSNDHVVPRHLIERKQPKAKGFDYAGVLATHEECNNRFGPEIYTRKALRLIEVLTDKECVSFRENAKDPSVRVLFINSDCLAEFTRRDLEFFKFIDMRATSTPEWSSPDFFPGKPKTNPTRDALFAALAVLTKSAAALLVSRYLKAVPARWRVLAFPYRILDESVDFDFLFGETKPFDVGVKVWLKPFEKGDWLAIYRARTVLVFFLFSVAGDPEVWDGMLARFADAERLMFEGEQLADLIDHLWKRV